MKFSTKRILIVCLPVLAIAALITIILLADRGAIPPFLAVLYAFPNGDKVGHFLLMGLIGFILSLTLPKRWKVPGLTAFLLALILEEISQKFSPNRSFDLVDLFFSLFGAGLFGWLGIWLSSRVKSKSRI